MLAHIGKECDHVVLDLPLDFFDALNVEFCLLTDHRCSGFRYDSKFGVGFTCEEFYFEPRAEFIFFRPDRSHPGTGVAWYHTYSNLKTAVNLRALFLQLHIEIDILLFPQHFHFQHISGLRIVDDRGNGLLVDDVLAVDLDDDVAHLESAALGGAVVFHIADDHSLGVLKTEIARHARVDRVHFQAGPEVAVNPAALLEFSDDALDAVDGDGEP